MAAKRKIKKSKTQRISFKLGALRRKKRQKADWFGPSLISVLKVLAVVCVFSGIVIGLKSLEKYVKGTAPASEGTVDLELAGVPPWVNDQLKAKVYAAVTDKAEDLRLDENAASSVQRNIEKMVVWLDEVEVRTTHDGLRVEGRWRKPVALVKSAPDKCYVDAEQIVLDFVPMLDLPIVEIKGLSAITRPPLGEIWQSDDLAAAVIILNRLAQRDKSLPSGKPLLYEIDRIDVSNFNGRQNSRHAHIILYSKDNTEIIWGAEVGKWQRHLESTDQEKLAKLYGYYEEHGKLTGDVKYINLRDPKDNIPLPIDKY